MNYSTSIAPLSNQSCFAVAIIREYTQPVMSGARRHKAISENSIVRSLILLQKAECSASVFARGCLKLSKVILFSLEALTNFETSRVDEIRTQALILTI
jgi:hypothetical protein